MEFSAKARPRILQETRFENFAKITFGQPQIRLGCLCHEPYSDRANVTCDILWRKHEVVLALGVAELASDRREGNDKLPLDSFQTRVTRGDLGSRVTMWFVDVFPYRPHTLALAPSPTPAMTSVT